MQLLVDAVVLAALYAMLAAGTVLIYRSSRVFNLAHGDLMTLGGYLVLAVLMLVGGNALAVLPAMILVSMVLGGAVYGVALRHFDDRPVASAVLATLAIGLVARSLVTLAWGAQTRYPLADMKIRDEPHYLIGGAVVSTVDVLSIVVATLFFVALAIVERHPLGIRMRAVAERPILAAVSGVDVRAVRALSWTLASAAAVIGVTLYSTHGGLQPDLWLVGLKGFVPALLGGMDSLTGAAAGAVIVATVDVIVSQFLDPSLVNAVPFLVALLILWIRPWGLFGAREELDRV
jgi:branched-chain amino acid transport system permease protein